MHTAKLVVGSLQGYLRIFAPQMRMFAAEDQLLEHNCEQPILQLVTGTFYPYGDVFS